MNSYFPLYHSNANLIALLSPFKHWYLDHQLIINLIFSCLSSDGRR